jgi:hypothetical protein
LPIHCERIYRCLFDMKQYRPWLYRMVDNLAMFAGWSGISPKAKVDSATSPPIPRTSPSLSSNMAFLRTTGPCTKSLRRRQPSRCNFPTTSRRKDLLPAIGTHWLHQLEADTFDLNASWRSLEASTDALVPTPRSSSDGTNTAESSARPEAIRPPSSTRLYGAGFLSARPPSDEPDDTNYG